eukprot:GHVQ01028689.1.p1 GENE.GHVQ01028689.1~~GHVQ01028689.1.p1  ORF type:complete len:466 (-),score=51.98 GHVQ01028689.1:202-1599(-)
MTLCSDHEIPSPQPSTIKHRIKPSHTQHPLQEFVAFRPPPPLAFYERVILLTVGHFVFFLVPAGVYISALYPPCWPTSIYVVVAFIVYVLLCSQWTIDGRPWKAHILRPVVNLIRRHVQLSVAVHNSLLCEDPTPNITILPSASSSSASSSSCIHDHPEEDAAMSDVSNSQRDRGSSSHGGPDDQMRKAHEKDKHRGLPSSKNPLFIFGVHPHGSLAFFRPALDLYLSEGILPFLRDSGWRALAASVLFWLPCHREVALWTNCCTADRSTAEKQLSRFGNSLMVTPGGIVEQLMTVRGRERLYITGRKGFVRLAIKYGCKIVPVYVFGENDLFATSMILYRFRYWLCKKLQICMLLFGGAYGFFPRGVSESSVGPSYRGTKTDVTSKTTASLTATAATELPYSPLLEGSLRVVFGEALGVLQQDSPDPSYVDKVHAEYILRLKDLFDTHKKFMGSHYETRELEIS